MIFENHEDLQKCLFLGWKYKEEKNLKWVGEDKNQKVFFIHLCFWTKSGGAVTVADADYMCDIGLKSKILKIT